MSEAPLLRIGLELYCSRCGGVLVGGQTHFCPPRQSTTDSAIRPNYPPEYKITQIEAHCADLADRAALAEQQRGEAVKLLREALDNSDVPEALYERVRAYLAKVQPGREQEGRE